MAFDLRIWTCDELSIEFPCALSDNFDGAAVGFCFYRDDASGSDEKVIEFLGLSLRNVRSSEANTSVAVLALAIVLDGEDVIGRISCFLSLNV